MLKDTLSPIENKQLERLMKTEPVKEEYLISLEAGKSLLKKKLVIKNKDDEYCVNWTKLKELDNE